MSHDIDVRRSVALPGARGAPGVLRWLCTRNPFYVLSALLFLAGLWISFGNQDEMEETSALMTGLGCYTLLLAGTACLLVRFGNVWDDVRTVLLLVVLMFLATSVTFDSLLSRTPTRGIVCNCVALVFVIITSELLLRGIRLRLPILFRLPYHLILALFFLYPIGLLPLVDQPHAELTMWAFFAFCPVAGLVFLTLLPAIHRGKRYVAHNGSPWRWPLYPWALFVVLACAVPARGFLLCWSLHQLPFADLDRLIFGPYFLVPFGFALAILVLEIGLVGNKRAVVAAALAMPAALLALAKLGHRGDRVYLEFLDIFTRRLGGDPLYVTLLGCLAFQIYAALRRVPLAFDAATATLLGLAVVGPRSGEYGLTTPQPLPLVVAAAVQVGVGLWRGNAWRCLAGTALAVLGAVLTLPPSPYRAVASLHLVLFALLLVGVLDDGVARLVRRVGTALVGLLSFAAFAQMLEAPDSVPPWLLDVYPLVLGLALGAYALLLQDRFGVVVAGSVLVVWLGLASGRLYLLTRQVVAGLDYLAASLLVFALAILVSLAKSGLLAKWVVDRWQRATQSAD